MRKILALLGILLSAPAFGQSIQVPAGQILGNSTATQRPAQASTVTAILDRALGSTAGSLLQRNASAWVISPIINIGPGIASVVGRPNNFNFYPINTNNGIQLSSGTGVVGEGGSITFYTKNITGSGAPIINQELGHTQTYAFNGVALSAGAPIATVYITTEAWTASANGGGVLFQATTRGETAARGEVCIAEGLKAMASGASSCQVGRGIGTLDSANGTYDNGNRVLSASNSAMTINQNAATLLGLGNNSAGSSALAAFSAAADVASVQVGSASSTFGTPLFAGRSFVFANSELIVGSSGANATIFAPNGTERARILTGFSVGTTSDAGAGMIYTNAATFVIRTKTSYANGAAAAAGTITNAPAAGNPSKWLPIDDNGTTRYFPAW